MTPSYHDSGFTANRDGGCPDVAAREPQGFVICIKRRQQGAKEYYVTWLQYGVVESSPHRCEAWVFATKEEAQNTLDRNVGRVALGLGQIHFEPANDNLRSAGDRSH